MCGTVAAVVAVGAKRACGVGCARATVVAGAISRVDACVGAARPHEPGAAVGTVAAERAGREGCTGATIVADAVAVVVHAAAMVVVVEVWYSSGGQDVARVEARVECGRRRIAVRWSRRQRRRLWRGRRLWRRRGLWRHRRAGGLDVLAALGA